MVAAMSVTWGQPGWARQDDPRLDVLFEQLAVTEEPSELGQIERSIWQVWLSSGDDNVDGMMAAGVRSMNDGNYSAAMAMFNAIVEAAPDFAEGWNKRATLYWLMGDYDASVADIDRTLALEPRHFGALSGLAMIRVAQERHIEAYEALKELIAVHPYSPGTKQRMRQIEQIIGPET
jgi:tetratricopeptide (TPR) repeat protein